MSLCNPPSISIPVPSIDPIATAKAILALLGIAIPPMPTFPMPSLSPFCPLD